MEFFINGTIDIPLLKKNLNSKKYCTDNTICVQIGVVAVQEGGYS